MENNIEIEYKEFIINELMKFNTFGSKLVLTEINNMEKEDMTYFCNLIGFLNALKEENVVLPTLRDWFRHFKK